MKHIKRFNESIDYNSYHTISNDDIEDISLEMTDAGFSIDIYRYFLNVKKSQRYLYGHVNSKSNEPISDECIPIYEIIFTKEEDKRHQDIGTNAKRFDGGLYYDDMNILKIFMSTLNKMKLLNVDDFGYCIQGERYTIRLFLKKLNLSPEKVGFDMKQFSNKFHFLLEKMTTKKSDEFDMKTPFIIRDYFVGEEAILLIAFTNGKYHSWSNKLSEWKKSESFDNKSEYDDYIKEIDEYLDKYKKFISYEHEFEEEEEEVRTVSGGFLRKDIINKYKKYNLQYKIKLK